MIFSLSLTLASYRCLANIRKRCKKTSNQMECIRHSYVFVTVDSDSISVFSGPDYPNNGKTPNDVNKKLYKYRYFTVYCWPTSNMSCILCFHHFNEDERYGVNDYTEASMISGAQMIEKHFLFAEVCQILIKHNIRFISAVLENSICRHLKRC